MHKEIDDEIASLLKSVVDHFDKEDQATRTRQIRQWKRLKLYWNNLSQIYWSETAQDYRIYGREDGVGSEDQEYYDKPVNVFKAFLETIIAALSIQIPGVSCVPDDADNPLDISTAKAGNKISEQIYKHNNAPFLWLHALYIYCTEGLIACHSYSEENKKYGTYEGKKYKDEEIESYICPNCNKQLDDELFTESETIENEEDNEFAPDDNDVELHDLLNKGPVCPECAEELDPNLQKSKLVIPRLVGFTTKAKSRVKLEVCGGLYVKVANYAKTQEDTPYLIYAYETHYVNPLEQYPHLKDELPQGGLSGNDALEQFARLNPQYANEYPQNNVTVRNCWLRCSSFNILNDEDYKRLKKRFPDGARVVFVNDICAEYENESLDDSWTLTKNPLSDYLTHDPLGELLTNIQDITNDIISLTLQTIEHGISQTWADPAVVDFKSFRQIEAAPGTITPTKPTSGSRSIGESFFSSKQASLSPEVFNFYRIINELGQFVSGALPSIFGGSQGKGSSNTASEYAMSRSGALQRLQTPWKMLNIWWKEIFGKAIPLYMKNMVEDERIVEKNDKGNFINIFIRRSEIAGSIGSIELDASDKMPITEEQQKEIVMELMQLNNSEIQGALLSPENLPFIKKVIRIPQFKLRGEDDRQKEYEVINELINSEPIILPPDPLQIELSALEGLPPPEETELPSVEVDELVDDPIIGSEVCRSWLVSDAGRLAKIENPLGYQNVLLRLKQYVEILQLRQLKQQQLPPEEIQGGKQKKPSGPKQKGPEKIEGENNVIAPVQ